MTRRERHERIVRWFDERSFRFARDRLLARRGLAAFTDEALEEFASDLWRTYRRIQEMNRQNRERANAKARAS